MAAGNYAVRSVVLVRIVLVLGFSPAIESDFFYTILVFPYTFFLAGVAVFLFGPFSKAIVVLLIFTTLFQYPAYGSIVSFAKRRSVVILGLTLIHASFSMLVFLFELSGRAKN